MKSIILLYAMSYISCVGTCIGQIMLCAVLFILFMFLSIYKKIELAFIIIIF